MNKTQLESLIIKVLKVIDLYNQAAVNLILGTIAQESAFGTYIRQLGDGPARGIIQMEPATERDIWENFLKYKTDLRIRIIDISGVSAPYPLHLEGNLIYQIIMCRVHYLRAPEPLPVENDISGLAAYWKQYYNTPSGKGTTSEFIANYKKYILAT